MEDPIISNGPIDDQDSLSENSQDPRLREELALSREEILRLRDLLIAKDVELGKVRGRLEQHEQRTARLLASFSLLRRMVALSTRLRGRSRD